MKTPKEKAEELVDKFQFCYVSPMYLLSARAHSKQCALITVLEIIDLLSQEVGSNISYDEDLQKFIEMFKNQFYELKNLMKLGSFFVSNFF